MTFCPEHGDTPPFALCKVARDFPEGSRILLEGEYPNQVFIIIGYTPESDIVLAPFEGEEPEVDFSYCLVLCHKCCEAKARSAPLQ